MKVWVRLGVLVDVDAQKFNETPSEAVLFALKEGKAFIDGDSYIPEQEVPEQEDIDQIDLQDSLPNIRICAMQEKKVKIAISQGVAFPVEVPEGIVVEILDYGNEE